MKWFVGKCICRLDLWTNQICLKGSYWKISVNTVGSGAQIHAQQQWQLWMRSSKSRWAWLSCGSGFEHITVSTRALLAAVPHKLCKSWALAVPPKKTKRTGMRPQHSQLHQANLSSWLCWLQLITHKQMHFQTSGADLPDEAAILHLPSYASLSN